MTGLISFAVATKLRQDSCCGLTPRHDPGAPEDHYRRVKVAEPVVGIEGVTVGFNIAVPWLAFAVEGDNIGGNPARSRIDHHHGFRRFTMMIACPQCSDTNVQRLSLAYESGISDVNTTTHGVGIGVSRGGIGLGLGSSRSHGTAQTALSQRTAPPPKTSYLKILKFWLLAQIIMFVLHLPGRQGLLYYLSIGVAGYALYQAALFNRNQWPALFEKWQQSFICLRCGNIFEGNCEDNDPEASSSLTQ